MTLPDQSTHRRLSYLERRIQEMEMSLARQEMQQQRVTPLSGRLWRFTLNEDFGDTTEHFAAADLLELDGTDTKLDVDVYDACGNSSLIDGDCGLCIEQLNLDGARYFVVVESGASIFYVGKVKTSAIESESCGTAEQYIYDSGSWVASGVTFDVYNPHDIELPVDLKVRWGHYPGWTECGTCETDWIVEPWHWTEC